MAVVSDRNLTPRDVVLYMILAGFLDGKCYAGEDWLAEQLETTERNVRQSLTKLRNAGHIIIERGRGFNATNRYHIVPPVPDCNGNTLFAMVPKTLIYAHNLHHSAKRLAAAIAVAQGDQEFAWASMPKLAESAAISERHAMRRWRELIRTEWLYVVDRSLNEYELNGREGGVEHPETFEDHVANFFLYSDARRCFALMSSGIATPQRKTLASAQQKNQPLGSVGSLGTDLRTTNGSCQNDPVPSDKTIRYEVTKRSGPPCQNDPPKQIIKQTNYVDREAHQAYPPAKPRELSNKEKWEILHQQVYGDRPKNPGIAKGVDEVERDAQRDFDAFVNPGSAMGMNRVTTPIPPLAETAIHPSSAGLDDTNWETPLDDCDAPFETEEADW